MPEQITIIFSFRLHILKDKHISNFCDILVSGIHRSQLLCIRSLTDFLVTGHKGHVSLFLKQKKTIAQLLPSCIHTQLTTPNRGFLGPMKRNRNRTEHSTTTMLRIPTGRRQASWLFTSATKKLNQELRQTFSTSGQDCLELGIPGSQGKH